MIEKKIQKIYTDYGFGFPIQIINAPLKKSRGSWTLDLNLAQYEKAILLALSYKSSRLSGNEIKFIRNYFEMSLKKFGEIFGNVSHAAVIKWEKLNDEPTHMSWPCEKDIRLFVINEIKPSILRNLYIDLLKVASSKPKKVKILAKDIKAA